MLSFAVQKLRFLSAAVVFFSCSRSGFLLSQDWIVCSVPHCNGLAHISGISVSPALGERWPFVCLHLDQRGIGLCESQLSTIEQFGDKCLQISRRSEVRGACFSCCRCVLMQIYHRVCGLSYTVNGVCNGCALSYIYI